MKVVALVPVKLNNERVPGKNLKTFSDGKTLMEFSLGNLDSVEGIDEIYVFSSSEEVVNYFPKNNRKIRFLQRPASLNTPETKSHDILNAFIDKVEYVSEKSTRTLLVTTASVLDFPTSTLPPSTVYPL